MQEVIRFGLLGLGFGGLYSLAAQGLVLMYRGSGVLNLAVGAIGIVGAYVAYDASVAHGLAYPLGVVLGIAASLVVGVLSYFFVMRPLRLASPLARIVATLGIVIILQSALALRYGSDVIFESSRLPQHMWGLWGDVAVPSDRLIICAVAGLLSVVLWAVYRFTFFGLATSAVAESERAASAVGLSPGAVATANWALGSALAGGAAILAAPLTNLQPTAGTNILLAATAAALVATFRSFPIAFGAGVAIGIAQTEIARYWAQPGADKAVPFVVIVAFLAVTGRGLPLRDYFLQRVATVGTGRTRAWLVTLAIAAAAAAVATVPVVWVDSLIVLFTVAIVLLSVVVLTGYAGQLSLAQYALAGLGAFIAGRLVATQHWPFWAAFVVGALGTIPIGVVFALPAVRTRGINLAIVTLGLGTVIELAIFNNAGWTGGAFGTIVGPQSLFGWSIDAVAHPQRYAYLSLGAFAILALAVANLRRGRTGRRLLAVRTNERAAASLGVNVAGAKLYAFGVSAGIAAVGGILIAFHFSVITYDRTFTSFTSITAVAWTFLGGIGYLAGPIVGAVLAPGSLGSAFTNQVIPGVSTWIPLIGGIGVIFMLLGDPNGVVAMNIAAARTAVTSKLAYLRPEIVVIAAVRALAGAVRGALGFTSEPRPHAALPDVALERVRPATLEVDELSVRYGAVAAVDRLSLVLTPGRITGLIGPNGSGKTSAIDAITGFTPLAGGSVSLNGTPIDSWRVERRVRGGVSRSFQSLELFEDASVLENLRIASDPGDTLSYFRDLVYPGSPPLAGEVIAAIKEFDLEGELDREVQHLAYGKRRLVAIARAVASRPSVLLLDEPAAGLSAVESAELARLVRRLASEWGMAVLVVEHDMSFVMSICDEIVVLDFGRTIGSGVPEVIRTDPRVVAAYLGEPGDADRAEALQTTAGSHA